MRQTKDMKDRMDGWTERPTDRQRFAQFATNKAGYTATEVACRWAGAIIEVTRSFGRSSEAKDRKNPKKVKCDGWMDGRTDGQTD